MTNIHAFAAEPQKSTPQTPRPAQKAERPRPADQKPADQPGVAK